MGSNRRAKLKSVYVVKSQAAELDELRKREKTETKSVYVLKESEEVVAKYQDFIYDFVDEENGVFLVISEDRVFFQGLLGALRKELALENEYMKLVSNLHRAGDELECLHLDGKKPFVFMEHEIRREPTLDFLQHIKTEYPSCLVTILSYEVQEGRLAQYHEAGADNFITKPASTNVLIEKIAFTLKPQSELQALVREGRQLLMDNAFEEAVAVAKKILELKPNSAVGFMILGDGLKGLARREEALRAYQNAEKGADKFLDPLKRIIEFYEEDGNDAGRLEYLVKLDAISPMRLDRKQDIVSLMISQKRVDKVGDYIDAVLEMIKTPQEVSGMSLGYAEELMGLDPVLAEKYYRNGIRIAKTAGKTLKPLAYNRLGLALRKQGKWRDAVQEYEEAAALSPGDENIQFNMAMALAEGKQWTAAVERLDKALEINPDFYKGNPQVAYHIGFIYRRAKKKSKALVFFQYVQEVSPGFKDVESVIEKLSS